MTKIPLALIISRLFIGFTLIAIPFLHLIYYKELFISLLTIGLLTDVFDGIIARKLGISTQKMRRLDSIVDQSFWLCALIASYLLCSAFFKEHSIKLFLIIILEGLTYVVSYLKFKKEVSTHAILSKIWTLSILAVLIQIVAKCNSVILFNVCFYLGIISRIEIVFITLIIKEWVTDVPSIYHAVLLRKGKTIKRNKFFNG